MDLKIFEGFQSCTFILLPLPMLAIEKLFKNCFLNPYQHLSSLKVSILSAMTKYSKLIFRIFCSRTGNSHIPKKSLFLLSGDHNLAFMKPAFYSFFFWCIGV
jgi:hypothetical protein